MRFVPAPPSVAAPFVDGSIGPVTGNQVDSGRSGGAWHRAAPLRHAAPLFKPPRHASSAARSTSTTRRTIKLRTNKITTPFCFGFVGRIIMRVSDDDSDGRQGFPRTRTSWLGSGVAVACGNGWIDRP